MPKPAETTPQHETEFDPLAFWIQHKGKVQFLAGLLVFGLLAYGIFQFAQKRSRDAAANDFARAKTADDFRKVIAAHPRSVVAANAHLMLAELQRNEGKHDEAITNLRAFIDHHGDHPLISGAWTSLAFSLEAQGKSEEALSTLQKVAATYPTSFAAPVALMAQARIYKARNEIAQAKRIYEQVVSQFGQSNFAREALMELQRLKKTETAPVPDAGPRLQSEPAAPTDAPTKPAAAQPGAEGPPASPAETKSEKGPASQNIPQAKPSQPETAPPPALPPK